MLLNIRYYPGGIYPIKLYLVDTGEIQKWKIVSYPDGTHQVGFLITGETQNKCVMPR